MRVISKKPRRDFWEQHPEAKPILEDWHRKAHDMTADSFVQLRQQFRIADYVDGITIFNVGGNRYRIAAVIHYDKQRIYIRHVMTHAEYDQNHWKRR